MVPGSNISTILSGSEAMEDRLQSTLHASGRGDWQEAWSYATGLVSQMTLEEKVNLTYGYTTEANGCNSKIAPIPRLEFKGICMNNAGNGVGGTEGSNAYPAALHVGASWSRELAYDRALYMGREFKQKGVNVALGPSIGPLGRIPKGGRNWEAPSNDPYLSGVLTYETTVGLQRSVMACVKHLIGNEQETTGAGSVMCAYQRVNNSYSCQNSKEMAFEGFVVPDWYEHKSGVGSANAGLDVVMPVAPVWQDGLLAEMVRNGSVSEARVDDMVKRVVAVAWRFADFEDSSIHLLVLAGGQPR
ncbi:unnamed protein product, partial [Clonostachys chloroleuca]